MGERRLRGRGRLLVGGLEGMMGSEMRVEME